MKPIVPFSQESGDDILHSELLENGRETLYRGEHPLN